MKFAVVNLGCKVNRVESDAAAAQLLAAGGRVVDQKDADLIVVNTCTVTGEAEKKTRKAVRGAVRANTYAHVVVTGCAAAIDAATYEAMGERVRVVSKPQLADALTQEIAAMWSLEDSTFAVPLRTGDGFPTRVGVKVQDGCNNACTYCIVHVARGRAVSRSADEVVAECTALARAGVREIVLTGINLGSYRDSSKPNRRSLCLADLLEQLLDETASLHAPDEEACRFRISSIEPCDVENSLVDLLAHADGRICRHLHLPLQAGSDRVLREMARPYCVDDYRALVDRLNTACPSLSLSTDVIVGFPGETEADFQDTLDVVKHCRFSRIHVFPYSRREGTPAAARVDQVSAAEKASRAAKLRSLARDLRSADLARRAGVEELLLVEGGGRAMSESYHEVAAPPHARIGSLVRAPLQSV